jgi:hypothetical protein
VLPLHACLWETDVAVRALVQQSTQVSLAPLGGGAILAGGELSGDARALGPRSLFSAETRARFERGIDLAGGEPETDVSADASASASWVLSPGSTFSLDALGSLATTWGVRADSLLLALDPFEEGRRLDYALGADLTYTNTVTPRVEVTVDAGVAQAGALDAEVPAAIGADSREVHGGASVALDLAPRLAMTPELRYSFTRYEHALLDVERRRGPAEIHAVTGAVAASREILPQLFVTAGGGLTVGSPMPIARTDAAVVAPEATLGVRWRGKRSQLTARYAWSYSSLGPRLGFGQTHSATLRLSAWPLAGAYKTSLLKITLRGAHGAAPIGADPPPLTPGLPPPPLTGALVVTTLAARGVLELPLARGWSLITGADLIYARGHLDPAPPSAEPQRTLMATLSVGLAVTAATDPRRRFPRAPGAEEDDAARRAAVTFGREEDRTGHDEGRGD